MPATEEPPARALGKKRQEIDKVDEIFPEPQNPEFYKRLNGNGLLVRPA
ncbi:MAG: hypothetical protein ABSC60_14180 [Acidobacteriota bacterium]